VSTSVIPPVRSFRVATMPRWRRRSPIPAFVFRCVTRRVQFAVSIEPIAMWSYFFAAMFASAVV
jgi:hypothetical protein